MIDSRTCDLADDWMIGGKHRLTIGCHVAQVSNRMDEGADSDEQTRQGEKEPDGHAQPYARGRFVVFLRVQILVDPKTVLPPKFVICVLTLIVQYDYAWIAKISKMRDQREHASD